MALEDNQVLPAATGAGGMNPQIQAFLNLLMGGGLHGFGGFGGQPFGGFGQFLMNNPSLMHGLGLGGMAPPGAAPVAGAAPAPAPDAAPVGPAAPVVAPTTTSQITPPAVSPEAPAAPAGVPAGGLGSLLSGGGPRGFEGLASFVPPLLRKG